MYIYRELYFDATSAQNLLRFKDFVNGKKNDVWEITEEKIAGCDYLAFEYKGTILKPAKSYVVIEKDNCVWHVCNVVPLKQAKLSYAEYNALVVNLYENLKKDFMADIDTVTIRLSDSDEFDISNVLSVEAVNKLKSFSSFANKSTGSAHPCDRKRWLDFICQTFADGREFDTEEFIRYLEEEENWSNEMANYNGPIDLYQY